MYNDPIIQKYIELIKSKCGDYKAFYQGDPIKIPASMLPCCIISKTASRAGPLNSAEDQHEIALTFTIISDIRQELSTAEDIAKVAPGIAKLYDLVEGRNANYTLKATSILQILRNNQLVDVANNLRTDLKTVTRIDYGQTLRNRNPAMWSVEANVEVLVNFSQVR